MLILTANSNPPQEPSRPRNLPPNTPPHHPGSNQPIRAPPLMGPAEIPPSHHRLIPRHRLGHPDPADPRRRSHPRQPGARLLRRADADRAGRPTPAGPAGAEDVLHIAAAQPADGVGDAERGSTEQGGACGRSRVCAGETARTANGWRSGSGVPSVADGYVGRRREEGRDEDRQSPTEREQYGRVSPGGPRR